MSEKRSVVAMHRWCTEHGQGRRSKHQDFIL